MIISAFTCTGPYAILILLGIKRVENRSAMPAPAKGRCAISCSKKFCAAVYGEFVRWASRALTPAEFETIPAWNDVKDWPGKIVGCCDYACDGRDARRPSGGASNGRDAFALEDLPAPRGEDAAGTKWDEGYPYRWDLSEVVAFERPIPCRGNVGMWQMPPALAAQVTATDALERTVGEIVATADDATRAFHVAVSIAGGNEGFFVLPLDAERRSLAAPILVSLGESMTTTVDPGEVFSAALGVGAKAIVVAHNHPSGDATPSVQDRELTAALKSLGKVLGVPVLDHLILGGESFTSI